MHWDKLFRRRRKVPDGLWMKCDGCQQMVFRKQVEERQKICPECNYHFALNPAERIDMLLDGGSFLELYGDMESTDPLGFADRIPYTQRLEEAKELSGLKEGAIVGLGTIDSHEVAFGILDGRFIRGSMGSVVGEKITRILELGLEKRIPVIVVTASAGARLHEGCLSLAQMAKTSAAVARLNQAGGLYISVLTNPTYGGVSASFAFLGDVILAEPKAMIGFAGARTILHTLNLELPKGFQTSESLMENGFLDMIVDRQTLRREIVRIIEYLPAFSRALQGGI